MLSRLPSSRLLVSTCQSSFVARRSLTVCASNSTGNLLNQQTHYKCHVKSRDKVFAVRTYVTPTLTRLMPIKTIDVPAMGDSISEGTIVDLPVAPGEYVQVDDVVVVLETDKVSVDVRAPEAGALVEILGEVDDVVSVGQNLFRIDTDADAPEPSSGAGPQEVASEVSEKPLSDAKEESAISTPREGEEKSKDGPSLTEPDWKEPPQPRKASKPAPPPPPPKTPPPAAKKDSDTASTSSSSSSSSPDIPTQTVYVGSRTERRTKMSRLRQRVAARLKSAQNTAAMLTTFQEVDMGNLMEMRNKHKEAFEKKHGVKLGFMSAFVKAATAALEEIPAVNAYIDDNTTEIVYREFVDISVAVASPTGLVVPVLRNTETMSFADVERNIALYAKKAKEGSLSLDDMTGGTFTISNGGVFGSLMGTPIINQPQSAILGMHATKLRAVVDKDGNVVARPMMYLALTYDHRLIDGREGVTFLKSIADKIADPTKLLLDL